MMEEGTIKNAIKNVYKPLLEPIYTRPELQNSGDIIIDGSLSTDQQVKLVLKNII